jgi:hypothetical protein
MMLKDLKLRRSERSEIPGEVKHLASVPQKFGIMPTMGFWDTQTPRIKAASFVVPSAAVSLLLYFGVPWYVALPTAYASREVTLGIFERWLRTKLVSERGRLSKAPQSATK